jgi:CRP-like cAMP-binding protein
MGLPNSESLYAFTVSLLGENPSEELWNEFAALHIPDKAVKGTILLPKGEICTSVNFITKGLARLYNIINGEEQTYAFIEEGFYFTDYVSILTGKPATTEIQALEDIEYLSLSKESMNSFYNKSLHAERFGRRIAELLFVELSESIYSIRTDSAEIRYEKFIQQHPKLINRVPQYLIAQCLNISPEHLSRIRRKIAMGNKVSG